MEEGKLLLDRITLFNKISAGVRWKTVESADILTLGRSPERHSAAKPQPNIRSRNVQWIANRYNGEGREVLS